MLIYTCWVKHCETWIPLVTLLRWGEDDRNCSYLNAFTEVYLRFIKLFNILNFSLFHKTFHQEKGYKGLKRYFWLKSFFCSWNIVMYMLAQTADYTFLLFPVIFCPRCDALLWLASPCSCCAPSAGPQEILSFVMEFFAGVLSRSKWHTLAQSFN